MVLRPRRQLNFILLAFAATLISFADHGKAERFILVPKIDGEWRSITSQPDLGAYNGKKQEPVDFAVWKARNGTWQLWSCIRGTSIGGNTRLFYRWQASSLQDTAWTPMGIAMTADTTLGETFGGLQAPHVIQKDGKYYMFYGDWNNICLATSDDGVSFERVLNKDNNARLFSGPLYNTRDPMILKSGDTYYCYYCAHNRKDDGSPQPQSAIYCRTSTDLRTWSNPTVVSRGGAPQKQTQWYGGDTECPFVVKINDQYILFRNQRYGQDHLNTQYCSQDPLNFGLDSDSLMTGQLKVAAPEIIIEDGQYYIVSLKPGLDGMQLAKLKFVPAKKTPAPKN